MKREDKNEEQYVGINVNKYISNSGFCSRREADDYLAQGRVTINGEQAQAGNRVLDGDVVEVDGEPLKKVKKTVYIAFHKPVGVTSTTDERDKTNIIDYLRFPQRIFPIGRLDKDSEGLIFLTNDGDIVNKILRAGNNHEKEYVVTVNQPLTPEFLSKMSKGVRILGTKTKPCKVRQEHKYVFRVVLTEGLNRQIRRMCATLGYKVEKLLRVRIMNVHLGKLPVGHWRYLSEEEMDIMQQLLKESSKTERRTPGSTQSDPKPPLEHLKVPEKGMGNKQEKKAASKKPKTFKEFRKSGKRN